MTPPKIVLQLSLVHSDGVARIECSRMSGELVTCVPLGAEITDVRALLVVVHAAEGRRKKVLLPDGRSLDEIMPTTSLESLFRGEEGAEPAAKKVKTA